MSNGNYDDMGLQYLDDEYENVDAAEFDGDFVEVPEGKYQATVDAVDLKNMKDSEVTIFIWKLLVLSPQQWHGKKASKVSRLETPDNLSYFKKDMETAGIQLGKLSDIQDPTVRAQLLGLNFEIQVKRNESDGKIYTNVYINKKLFANEVQGQNPAEKFLNEPTREPSRRRRRTVQQELVDTGKETGVPYVKPKGVGGGSFYDPNQSKKSQPQDALPKKDDDLPF